MITLPHRHDQNIAVFGLSASGLAAARALADSGVAVAAWDDDKDKRDVAAAGGIPLIDPFGADWSGVDALVLTPGVSLTHPEPHPVVTLARDARCAIIGDIELLVEACAESTFVGVTGTNGKSTTTSLIAHVLGAAGRTVEVGGNLGPPALSLEKLAADGIYVLELSSYQLDLTQETCFDVAVFLNLTPDHLDRHGDMDGYYSAKRRIFRDRDGAAADQVAIIGVDDDYGRQLCDAMSSRDRWRCIRVSGEQAVENGVYVLDGKLFDATEGTAKSPICDLNGCATLPGRHNWQNAAAAYASARALGVAPPAIAAALPTFPGLPHRQELVATIGGIRYVNDSKATNGEAASRAVASYDDIYLIAGGLPKDGGLAAIAPLAERVRHAFLIGDAAAQFADELDGLTDVTVSGDLAAAVRDAHRLAQSDSREGAVVLLSPACASFDQWPNFEARGDAFREMVRKLTGGGAS